MIHNKNLITDLGLLMKAKQWKAVRSWFLYTDEKTTHRIIYPVLDAKGETIVIDTGVAEEFIDKVLIWGHFFLPDYLRNPSPEFHRDLIALFFSNRNEFVAAPRGFSKTTMIQLCTAFSVAHNLDRFIVIVEKSFGEAGKVLEGVRDILLSHKTITQVYGKMKTKVIGDESKDQDARGDLVINGVCLRGKGFDAPIRGLKYKAYRPSRIVLDDVESDAHINNPEQRQKYMENFNKGIQPAIDIDGTIKMFGTILHFDSLLMNLIRFHKGKIYRAYDPKDPKNTLLWKERWSLEKLTKKLNEMATEKGSSAFYQEYLNDPVSDDERTFKQQWLWRSDRMVKMTDLQGKVFNGYATIDVADSTKDGSDWTGVVVHLVDCNGFHYRVSCRRERLNILGKVNLIFELWNKWRPWGLCEIGVEKKAFTDEILPLLEPEMNSRHIYPIVSELRPLHNSKTNRIKGNLQGRYEMGKIWTVLDDVGNMVEDTEALLNELYDFPASKKDDLSDAEAYIPDMVQVPLEQGVQKPQMAHSTQEDPFAFMADKETELTIDDDPFD